MALLLLLPALRVHAQTATAGAELKLDGMWQAGVDRKYDRTLRVPGLASDPATPSAGTLWFRRTVHLPAGTWDRATLQLGGARFSPAVYVNGEKVSQAEGGMAPTVHPLRSPAVRPGADITLEIALASMTQLDPRDASMVPQPDRWRSDNSSGLWDSVVLHLAHTASLTHVTPQTDWTAHTLQVRWVADAAGGPSRQAKAELLDAAGHVVAATAPVNAAASQGTMALQLPAQLKRWSPSDPVLYRLRVSLVDGSVTLDQREANWGLRSFATANKRFMLNGEPTELRGGTVVWHRFLRNPAAEEIAWNTEWFRTNVVLRLKGYGANYLRFHLGLPPEALLDLCDREGLMVQMEWPFFHGVKASEASMREQWHQWLDVAMRHPSVVLIHPWNETSGDELKTAWTAMNSVLADYPPLVVAERDTLHIHKYWWSLFENLGLYYDSADQFDRTIMVDEFGGDYLTPDGGPGAYPAVRETMLRFLGRDQTAAGRLKFQAEANGRVAEYWRRIGAAGIAPFCIMSSPQDGNSWFLGDIRHPQPMPVWDALAAAFSPQSISLDVWDRNYTPGQHVTLPLYFFNDTENPATLHADVQVLDANSAAVSTQSISQLVPAHGRMRTEVSITLPQRAGDWKLQAVLRDHVVGVVHPIVSAWDVRTLKPSASSTLAAAVAGVPSSDPELRSLLERHHVKVVDASDPTATVVATSLASWSSIGQGQLRHDLELAVDRGVSVVMLDIGPQDLGQAGKKGDLSNLQGAPRILPGDGYVKSQDLFSGLSVKFVQVAEPESHIQPGPSDASLWQGLSPQATWLWNGLRGGLIAPAAEMEISGLGTQGFVAEWAQRGADPALLNGGSYFAYRLAAYYAFSTKSNDVAVQKALRDKVAFLVEDAPALKDIVDPNAKIQQTDLAAELRKHSGGRAEQLIALSTCGKSLTRTDVAEITFGTKRGRVILSQVMTAGRLQPEHNVQGPDGLRYDPAAEQFVLNMLADALNPASAKPMASSIATASPERR